MYFIPVQEYKLNEKSDYFKEHKKEMKKSNNKQTVWMLLQGISPD